MMTTEAGEMSTTEWLRRWSRQCREEERARYEARTASLESRLSAANEEIGRLRGRLEFETARRTSGGEVHWWFRHERGGRTVETWLTTAELRDLVEQGAEHLERTKDDE